MGKVLIIHDDAATLKAFTGVLTAEVACLERIQQLKSRLQQIIREDVGPKRERSCNR